MPMRARRSHYRQQPDDWHAIEAGILTLERLSLPGDMRPDRELDFSTRS